MKNLLKAQYTKTGKAILIEALISSVVLAIIIYVIVGPLGLDVTKLLEALSTKNAALEFALYLLPALLIVNLTISLGLMIIKKK